MTFRFRVGLGVIALTAALACARPDAFAGRTDSSGAAPAAGGVDSAAAGSANDPAVPATWTVRATGIGPVRSGMTIAQAERALGAPLAIHPEAASCAYVRPRGVPAGVAFMIVDGRVARVDVDSGAVRTAAGAGIGDSEARVRSLYASRVEVQPQKYTDGHSLVVTPPAPEDSANRIIFETDSQRVTRYRAGQLPEVAWVERCG